MNLIVFVVCLVLVLKRRRRGETTLVPSIIGAASIVGGIWSVVALVRSLEAVASVVNPADKATILAAGISEALNTFAFWFIVEVPILIGALFVDRWLRKREDPPTST